MYLIEKYFGYWPVIVGTAVFLVIGLLVWLVGERAMERSRKPLSWVGAYRQPGFPLRKEVLSCGRFPIWVALLAALFALAVSAGLRAVGGLSMSGDPLLLLRSRYQVITIAVSVVGAICVAALLHIFFDSPAISVLGTLLFTTAPAYGHIPACLLALCLLLLVLYLRIDRGGFAPELLYLLAALVMACAIASQPRTVLFAPFMILVHWYKLGSLSRAGRMRFGTLVLALLAALVCWCAFAVLSALLRTFMFCGFGIRTAMTFVRRMGIKLVCAELYYYVRENLLLLPRRNLLLYPMMEAPLFGLGLFGALSALKMGIRRRDPRGWFCFLFLLLTIAVWICTGCYVVTLGLTLCTGCLLKNCAVGKKLGWAAAACVLGALYHLALTASSWLLPLVTGVADRITS